MAEPNTTRRSVHNSTRWRHGWTGATAAEARAHRWTEEERALVVDRVDTQVVGSPATVVVQLGRLVDLTGADEVVVTTMTHNHADRVRSYALLAEHWDRGS